MPEFVDSTVKDIDARVNELRQELSKLEAARAALVGNRPGRPRGSGTTRRRRAAGTTTARRTRRTRGRRRGTTRAAQSLELIRGKPGITIPEIAKQMGIEPNYLYRVLPKLQQEGQIKKSGTGWAPA